MGKHTTLPQFEFFVLIALDRLGKGGHAAGVRRHIEERGDRTVSLGAVYAALNRLDEKGLVESRLGEPTPRRGGRARKYFRLTQRGRGELVRTESTILRMLDLAVEGDPVP